MSFVYLNSGMRFGKTGSYDMVLPKLDIPISILSWEISLPDRLEVKQFGGNVLAAELFPASAQNVLIDGIEDISDLDSIVWSRTDLSSLEPGQIGGIVVDAQGAVIPNADVTVSNSQRGVSQTVRSDSEGRWVVSGMEPGPVSITVASQGFKNARHEMELSAAKPVRLGTTLEPGNVSEVVTVTAAAGPGERESRRLEERVRRNQQAQLNAPSQNVFNLQKRVAGVLPVRVEVPRAGKSYRFVRPLVMEEETTVTFQYKYR